MKWHFKSGAIIILLFLASIAMIPRPSFGIDCSQMKDELSWKNRTKLSHLIADRKLDAALKELDGKLEYLSCIKDFNDDYVDAIQLLASDLGGIYSLQELDEKKALALYEERIGKHIRDREVELYVFYNFVQFFAGAEVAHYSGTTEKKGNVCTLTTDWGTVYIGCDKVYRVVNSPIASVVKTNELSLANALFNIAYILNTKSNSNTCYKKEVPFKSYYDSFSMMIEESRIMIIVEKAPIMAKKLLDKSLKLDESSSSLADFCRYYIKHNKGL